MSPMSPSRYAQPKEEVGIVKDLQALPLGMMPLGGIEPPLTGLQNPLQGQAELVLKKGLREIPRRHRAPDVLQGLYRGVARHENHGNLELRPDLLSGLDAIYGAAQADVHEHEVRLESLGMIYRRLLIFRR
jgi:hypothetical protein